MIDRTIEPILKELAAKYPVVTITGPRQSGKTTLCRKVFPDMAYANLERPDIGSQGVACGRRFRLWAGVPMYISTPGAIFPISIRRTIENHQCFV